MPKFKVGDRVRVANVSDKHAWIKHLEGASGLVKKVFKCANQDVGCYDIGLDYIINEPELELISTNTHRFKVGDKVKFVRTEYPFKKELIGQEFTIKRILPDRYTVGAYSVDRVWLVLDTELELVKPKFNINDYPGYYIMRCINKNADEIFRKYMHSIGKRWCMGQSYETTSYFDSDRKDTCFDFNKGLHSNTEDYDTCCYTILEFDDFDWSDFTMKKEFTKKDLKNGDVIKRRCGSVEIVCIDTGTIITKNGWNDLKDINDDLTYKPDTDWDGNDIVAVRRPNEPMHCNFDAFDRKYGTLVYERKEVEEMTLEEVCKALGKDIKIVKK
jgi:hypothetical protein